VPPGPNVGSPVPGNVGKRKTVITAANGDKSVAGRKLAYPAQSDGGSRTVGAAVCCSVLRSAFFSAVGAAVTCQPQVSTLVPRQESNQYDVCRKGLPDYLKQFSHGRRGAALAAEGRTQGQRMVDAVAYRDPQRCIKILSAPHGRFIAKRACTDNQNASIDSTQYRRATSNSCADCTRQSAADREPKAASRLPALFKTNSNLAAKTVRNGTIGIKLYSPTGAR
jgi:hypothetical protein